MKMLINPFYCLSDVTSTAYLYSLQKKSIYRINYFDCHYDTRTLKLASKFDPNIKQHLFGIENLPVKKAEDKLYWDWIKSQGLI